MVLIVKPSVELFVFYPHKNGEVFSTPSRFIETAGRKAYQSLDKMNDDSNIRFTKMIKANGHTSVLEHSLATAFIISDRGVMAELTRHRAGTAFTVESTRYCNYSKDKFGESISVIEPSFKSLQAKNLWIIAVNKAEETYMDLIKNGESPEIARSILPTCLKTEIVMSGNFRAWLHVLETRTASDAHPQAREVMNMVKDQLTKQLPEIFGE